MSESIEITGRIYRVFSPHKTPFFMDLGEAREAHEELRWSAIYTDFMVNDFLSFQVIKNQNKESNVSSRVVIDRSPIACFRKLEVGYDLSVIPSSFLSPPPPIYPICRSINSRIDSNIELEPILVTDLAKSGPDTDITLSIESLAGISSSVCFDTGISIIFYVINGNFFFDEPIYNEYHKWSKVFNIHNLKVENYHTTDLATLARIASHAHISGSHDKWFGVHKDGVVLSERSQQRFFRDTEKLLNPINENFSRSYACNYGGLSLHVGSNSIICQIDNDDPAILRYSDEEPTKYQTTQWKLESIISACDKVLCTSSSKSRLTKFEIQENIESLYLSAVFANLNEIREKIKDDGCYLLHKNSNVDMFYIKEILQKDLESLGLMESYLKRISSLQTAIGYRQTLATSLSIIEIGRKNLVEASQAINGDQKALVLERLADSLILPLLLLDRYSSLIFKKLPNPDSIKIDDYQQAISVYESILSTENVSNKIIDSVKMKIASIEFSLAMLQSNIQNADASLNRIKDIENTNEFKLNVLRWKSKQLVKEGNFHLAHLTAESAFSLASKPEDKGGITKLLGKIDLAFSQELIQNNDLNAAEEKVKQSLNSFKLIESSKNLAECEANLAFIKRKQAMNIAISQSLNYTILEEKLLDEAKSLFYSAIQRLQNTSLLKSSLQLDLCTLLTSVITRIVQSPPIDRKQPSEIISEVESIISEAHSNIKQENHKERSRKQIAALKVWTARFYLVFKAKYADNKIATLNSAKTLLEKARQFFISDTYPADFLSISLSLAETAYSLSSFKEALHEIALCLNPIQPRALAIPSFKVNREQTDLSMFYPQILELSRIILKDYLRYLMKSNSPYEKIRNLYSKSLSTIPEQITEFLIEINKSIQ